MKKPPITSPYAPDLEQVRAWLKEMIAAMRFVALVKAVVAFIERMCVINGELTTQLVNLRRKRPKSETLRRLEGNSLSHSTSSRSCRRSPTRRASRRRRT